MAKHNLFGREILDGKRIRVTCTTDIASPGAEGDVVVSEWQYGSKRLLVQFDSGMYCRQTGQRDTPGLWWVYDGDYKYV